MKQFFFLSFTLLFSLMVQSQKYNLLIGTYTNSCESDGIYTYQFDSQTADFTLKSSTKKTSNPSFLTVSPDKKFVYAVNENGPKSQISSFKYDAENATLKFINAKDSQGADPCHIINDEKNVLVANYSGGTISVYKTRFDGMLFPAAQVIAHQGSSVNKQRQESPHVHMLQFTPDKKYVLASDLGTDRIYSYRYDANSQKKVLQLQDTVPIKTASGPRHLSFSPDGKYVYLLQELDGTLTVFAYTEGKLERIQETSVVSSKFPGETSAAAIKTSSDGRFVYATNRGQANTISVFEVAKSGKLVLRETIATLGKGPRDFSIDPSGKYVLIAHQYSNDIVVFSRDAKNGSLKSTGKKLELCSPVCLVFDTVAP